jgi:hypothetical protein
MSVVDKFFLRLIRNMLCLGENDNDRKFQGKFLSNLLLQADSIYNPLIDKDPTEILNGNRISAKLRLRFVAWFLYQGKTIPFSSINFVEFAMHMSELYAEVLLIGFIQSTKLDQENIHYYNNSVAYLHEKLQQICVNERDYGDNNLIRAALKILGRISIYFTPKQAEEALITIYETVSYMEDLGENNLNSTSIDQELWFVEHDRHISKTAEKSLKQFAENYPKNAELDLNRIIDFCNQKIVAKRMVAIIILGYFAKHCTPEQVSTIYINIMELCNDNRMAVSQQAITALGMFSTKLNHEQRLHAQTCLWNLSCRVFEKEEYHKNLCIRVFNCLSSNISLSLTKNEINMANSYFNACCFPLGVSGLMDPFGEAMLNLGISTQYCKLQEVIDSFPIQEKEEIDYTTAIEILSNKKGDIIRMIYASRCLARMAIDCTYEQARIVCKRIISLCHNEACSYMRDFNYLIEDATNDLKQILAKTLAPFFMHHQKLLIEIFPKFVHMYQYCGYINGKNIIKEICNAISYSYCIPRFSPVLQSLEDSSKENGYLLTHYMDYCESYDKERFEKENPDSCLDKWVMLQCQSMRRK